MKFIKEFKQSKKKKRKETKKLKEIKERDNKCLSVAQENTNTRLKEMMKKVQDQKSIDD